MTSSPTASVGPFRLAHLSDPHLAFEPRLTLRQRFSKRQLSALSWWRSRHRSQQADLLDRLIADARPFQPEHWAITGDIVNFSLPGEFTQAARWLDALDARDRVSIVPGNHDALVAMPVDQGWLHWQPWVAGDDGHPAWPYWRQRGDVALIGVSSALPTAPLLASGRIGTAQLQRLAALLDELGRRGLCRVLMIHHPPAAGAISRRKALADAAELRALLARHGAELVIHGHARDARLDAISGPAGPIPVLGLPSASALPSSRDGGSRWQLLELEPAAAGGWRLRQRVRLWDVGRQGFVSAGDFVFALPRQIGG